MQPDTGQCKTHLSEADNCFLSPDKFFPTTSQTPVAFHLILEALPDSYATRRVGGVGAGLYSMLKLYKGIIAVQLAVKFRVEDAFISAFSYLDLKLRFFVKKVRLISRILIAQQYFLVCTSQAPYAYYIVRQFPLFNQGGISLLRSGIKELRDIPTSVL